MNCLQDGIFSSLIVVTNLILIPLFLRCFIPLLFAIVTCTAADNPRNIVPMATETPVRGSMISQEFYPDGKLKSRCVFAAIDTIEQINPETLRNNLLVLLRQW